jgi:hypothetical protein
MQLVIPDGAEIHITVGRPTPLALAHNPHLPLPAPVPAGRRFFKGLALGTVLVVAFQAGRWLPHHPDTVSAAQASSAALPAQSTPEHGVAADIPPAFRAQMAQPPQVIPPPGKGTAAPPTPGTPDAGAPSRPNPFGLQD